LSYRRIDVIALCLSDLQLGIQQVDIRGHLSGSDGLI
jgi:hypothetical protein